MRRLLLTYVAMLAVLFAAPSMASETVTYSYDALGRLVGSSVAGGTSNGVQSSTAFDPARNRTTYSVSGVPVVMPTFSINNVAVTEGTALVFTITKSGTASGSLSVNYTTSDGSATSPADYASTSGTVTFLASETSITISVPTVDDTLVEGNQTMTVTLSGASPGSTISTAVGTGTINDNDAAAPASIAISDATAVTEGGTLSFTVTKSGSTASSFSVNYATTGGTATSGTDFTPKSGTLTWPGGNMAKTITIQTIDDAVSEPSETVVVTLSAPTGGAAITTAQGTGTITDNDP